MSPFASINDSLPPLMPPEKEQQGPQSIVFAPIHAPTHAPELHVGGHTLPAPDVDTQDSDPSTAQLAPLSAPKPPSRAFASIDPTTTPGTVPGSLGDEQQHVQAHLAKDYQKDADPYGSPDNHPGVFGKILHGLNVATGGNERRQAEENQLGQQVNQIQADKDTSEGKQATTEEAKARVPLLNAQADAAENGVIEITPEMAAQSPSLTPLIGQKMTQGVLQHILTTHETVSGRKDVATANNDSREAVAAEKNDTTRDVASLKPQPQEAQFIAEYQQKNPGSSIADAQHAYMLNSQPPKQVTPQMMFAPTPEGGQIAEVVKPGTKIAPGTQTSAGVNAVSTPTMQQRTAAGRAETVLSQAPMVLKELDTMAPKMGPIMGNWNAFTQGKIGMDDPDFAGLRSDLVMMSTAVALAHAQGRLPENLREEFDHMMNAPQQSVGNLKATINHILPWMQKMKEQGNVQTGGGASEPARPANVPPGYRYDAKGPKGAGWYK